MTGIHYVTDEKGRKVAVQIDLREHSELWEEIEDVLTSQSRRHEESIPIEQVEAKLVLSGKTECLNTRSRSRLAQKRSFSICHPKLPLASFHESKRPTMWT